MNNFFYLNRKVAWKDLIDFCCVQNKFLLIFMNGNATSMMPIKNKIIQKAILFFSTKFKSKKK